MKKISIPISIFFITLLIITGCRKNDSVNQISDDSSLIINARRFFETYSHQGSDFTNPRNPRLSAPKSPDWDSAYIIQTAFGKGVVVPIRYAKQLFIRTGASGRKLFDANDLTRLFVYQDNHKTYHVEVITSIPDSSYLRGNSITPDEFAGLVLVDDWRGNNLKRYVFNGKDGQKVATKFAGRSPAVEICYELDGYNYSIGDPAHGEYWSESGCYDFSFGGGDGGSSGEGSGPSGSDYGGIAGAGGSVTYPEKNLVVIQGGDKPIANVREYTKCFTNVEEPGISYNVTLCVLQPWPGTREKWSTGSSGSSGGPEMPSAGHTFLIFREQAGSGTITRNIGFYPQGMATPISPVAKGQMNNDEAHLYNISLTIKVDHNQFFNMLNYVNDCWVVSPPTFNLNTLNCTTYSLYTLQAGGIYIPATEGSWPMGKGYNPGDLGEDIRAMTLASNMARSTTPLPHPNTGTCN